VKHTWSMRSQEEFDARLAKGRELAPSLVGLGRDEAVQQVVDEGFQAHVIPPTDAALTCDLNPGRIRLFLDEHDRVVRANAG
jgi:Potato inhibitor I family